MREENPSISRCLARAVARALWPSGGKRGRGHSCLTGHRPLATSPDTAYGFRVRDFSTPNHTTVSRAAIALDPYGLCRYKLCQLIPFRSLAFFPFVEF